MSIRLRLTLLYSAILLLTLLVAGLLLLYVSSRVTLGIVREGLMDDAARIVATRNFTLGQLDITRKEEYAPEIFIQSRSLDGAVLDRTANLGSGTLPISAEGVAALQAGNEWWEIAPVATGRLYIYSKPVQDQQGTHGIVQVGRSLADYDQSLQTLERILVLGGSLITLLAFGVGWLLAGAALRPINSIIASAQAIGNERNFDRRVEYTGPSDEIGTLAATINAMLEQLRAAYWQMDQALQTQRRFVADASHELRTPLTTIRGNLELLQRELPIPAEERAAIMQDVVEECDRLIRLVKDMLVLARSDARAQSARLEPVAVAPLLDELCRQVHPLDPQRIVHCDAPSELQVLADRDALKQVLLILLDNSFKYASGPVTLRAAQIDIRVCIRVVDQGPGVPAELLPQIFERFYRVDKARSGNSAGLGLAIARVLVESQGGTISAASQPGQGSTFTVCLPVARPAATF
jgi:two-component system, OmpR family, sensor kinase